MTDLVEKLQLELDKILLQFKHIGLKKQSNSWLNCYNRKPETLIEDKYEIELLNNVMTSQRRSHLNHQLEVQLSITTEASVHPIWDALNEVLVLRLFLRSAKRDSESNLILQEIRPMLRSQEVTDQDILSTT